jgi:hypothetical protein
MICLVDARGDAQCHHQGGVLHARVDAAAGTAVCAGADVQLRSPCAGSSGCLFPAVPVPAGAFGLLVVELRPLVFGFPRHVVVDAAALSDDGGETSPTRMSASLDSLARCLAPGSATDAAATHLLRVERSTCENGFCVLRRTRLKLASS